METDVDNTDDVKILANEILQMFTIDKKDDDWVEEIQIKTHTLKGLCGIYGLTASFNHLKIMEKFMKVCAFNKIIINREIVYFKTILSNLLKEKNRGAQVGFTAKDIRYYKIVYNFSTVAAFENMIHVLNELTFITNIHVDSRKIVIEVLSQIPISDMKQMLFALGIVDINVIKHKKVSITKPKILKNISSCINCICYKIVFLHLLEMCNQFSKYTHKQFKLSFYSNVKHFTLEFWKDLKIPFMELMKNAFAHSSDTKKLRIIVNIVKIKDNLRIYVYNSNSKIKSGNQIFDYQYTTSKSEDLSGNGVGLFETERLINSFGGTIKYRNKMFGVYFLMSFPNEKFSAEHDYVKL